MTARWWVHLLALVLLGGLATGCADSAATTDAAGQDVAAPNDLAPDVEDAAVLDAGRDVRLDAPGDAPSDIPADRRVDAALDIASDIVADRPQDAGVDVPVDAGVDVPVVPRDVPSPWGDTPLVDLGGIVVPVDPHAVPAPGSECTGDAGARGGDPTIAPPRPIRPLSVSRVTSQRPSFQWVLPEGTTGARVEVCADRCCARVIQTFDAEGTTTRPMTTLPPGVVFWRMFGRRGSVVGSRASYTWEFGVRHRDAPNDTSWGTLRDFNGDGFDDQMVFRAVRDMDTPCELVTLFGSAAGLRAPVGTGMIAPYSYVRNTVGDFNGDGLADFTWGAQSASDLTTWFEMVYGSREPLQSIRRASTAGMGLCARTSGGGAAVDWNGDGYSDLIVSVVFGCGLGLPITASVLLCYFGSSQGIGTIPQWALRLDGRFSHPWVALSGALGDVDNDGRGDVMVVSRFYGIGTSTMPADQVIVHGADGIPSSEVLPNFAGWGEGWANGVSTSIGDVDGDHFLDLAFAVGSASSLYVYRHATGLSMPDTILRDPTIAEQFAFSFGSGDVNGDGLADVIASSELAYLGLGDAGLANLGRVYVFPGTPGGVRGSPLWVEGTRSDPARAAGALFGAWAMSPGDVNGDGIDDVTMGDSVARRLCVRAGRVGLGDGSPDYCIDGALDGDSRSY